MSRKDFFWLLTDSRKVLVWERKGKRKSVRICHVNLKLIWWMIYWFHYEESHHHLVGRPLPRLPSHRPERRRSRSTRNRHQRHALRALRRRSPFPGPPHRHPDLIPVIIWYTYLYQSQLNRYSPTSLCSPQLAFNGNHIRKYQKFSGATSWFSEHLVVFPKASRHFSHLFWARYDYWIYWINTIK